MEKEFMLILKTISTFLILLLYTRLLGKKQMSQLTYFNYITGLVIGTISASIIFDKNYKFYEGVIILTTWFILTGLIDWITFKIQGLKSILNGKPTIIIQNGKLDKKALRKQRLTLEELRLMIRELKIFSLKEIDYAILETNGKLSILKNVLYQNVSKNDMNVTKANPLYLPTEVIIDGKILKKNLKDIKLTENDILMEIKKAGLQLKDILYAEIEENGSIYFDIEKGS